MNGGGSGDGAEEVVLKVAALPILHVVRHFTTRGVLRAQPLFLWSVHWAVPGTLMFTHATWEGVRRCLHGVAYILLFWSTGWSVSNTRFVVAIFVLGAVTCFSKLPDVRHTWKYIAYCISKLLLRWRHVLWVVSEPLQCSDYYCSVHSDL